ncbi:hypothetical protein ACHAWO_005541 [Cyclotella atomus]|uniref:Uncharacterized protein n=1 Tax=Cyclotella atomus TaxID=382360 RepID=A0ABD3NJG0_9STRA
MTAQDIDGKAIAATIREELTNKLSTLPSSITTRPIVAPTTPVNNLKPPDSSKQYMAGRRRNVPPSQCTEMCEIYSPERA